VNHLATALAAIAPARLTRPGAGRVAELMELDEIVWHERVTPTAAELFPTRLDFERTFAIEAPGPTGPVLAAMAATWGGATPVPGGRVGAAQLTGVSVRPGFRRRGFLRALMAAHFADCRDRGEAISLLIASEMPIYGRFGYGTGTRALRLRLRRGAALRTVDFGPASAVTLHVETASYEKHAPVVDAVQRAIDERGARPGRLLDATEGLRRARFAEDRPSDAMLEPLRILTAHRDGEPVGYAMFRRDGNWVDGVPSATAHIRQLQAADMAAAHAMWSELIGSDLVQTIVTPPLPADDPLIVWLQDWRGARAQFADHEHVRLIDLPAALAARTYASPIDLVLDVTDPQIEENAGLWRLVGGPDGAHVERAEPAAQVDVALEIRELGALYLGALSAAALADAGLIRERVPGAALALGRAFRGDREPGTPREF
jgi:predicted acetyltransferase